MNNLPQVTRLEIWSIFLQDTNDYSSLKTAQKGATRLSARLGQHFVCDRIDRY